MKKLGNVILKILLTLSAVIVLFYVVTRVGEPLIYKNYFDNAQKEYKIAGLEDNLVVQGIACIPEKGLFLQSGYMKDHSTSRIYVADPENGISTYVLLEDAEGNSFTGHAGGIAVKDDFVWVCGEEKQILVYSLTEILEAENGAALTANTMFETGTGSSCCFVDEDYLWVTEFYREQNYQTEESHHLATPEGGINYAIALAYPFDGDSGTGVAEQPVAALSLPDEVQGLARDAEGRFILSCSYGLASSRLHIYDNVLENEPQSSFAVEDCDVDLWYLDSTTRQKLIRMPPMSEALDYYNGRVYIMYESATNKYIFGKLYRGSFVYSFEVE